MPLALFNNCAKLPLAKRTGLGDPSGEAVVRQTVASKFKD